MTTQHDILINKTAFGAGHAPVDITNAFTSAVQEEIAKCKRNGLPVARYEAETKRAYFEYADGTREYIND